MVHTSTIKIGVISDTHGSLPGHIADIFCGVDFIIHAGDIGGQRVLDQLGRIAPVYAVCGNMDRGGLRSDLSGYRVVSAGDILLYVVHDIYDMNIDPEEDGVTVVVSGHTHCQHLERREGVMYLNPGSARHPRGSGASVAVLTVAGKLVDVDFVNLD